MGYRLKPPPRDTDRYEKWAGDVWGKTENTLCPPTLLHPPNNQPLFHTYKISLCLVRLGFGRAGGRQAGGWATEIWTDNSIFCLKLKVGAQGDSPSIIRHT